MTSVYVIQAEGGPVKIGVANKPDKRLAVLRTGTPYRLSLAHVEEIQGGMRAKAVERAAHALLCAAHAHGEWFNVSVDEARSAVHRAIAELRQNPLWEPPSQREHDRVFQMRVSDAFLATIRPLAQLPTGSSPD